MHREPSDLYRRLLEQGTTQQEIEQVYKRLRSRGYGEEAARARAERLYRDRRQAHRLVNLGEQETAGDQDAGDRSALDAPAPEEHTPEGSVQTTPGGRGEGQSGERLARDEQEPGARLRWSPTPQAALRRRINAYAFSEHLLITGMRERLRDLLTYLSPNVKDGVNRRLLAELSPTRGIEDRNPYDYSLVEALQALRSAAAFFLGVQSSLAHRSAPVSSHEIRSRENVIVEAIRRREAFVLAYFRRFAEIENDLIHRLSELEIPLTAGRTVEAGRLAEIARKVYNLTVSTEAVKPGTLRRAFEVLEDILLAYGSVPKEEIQHAAEVFIIARERLQSFSRELYPVVLRAINRFYPLSDDSPEKRERIRAFSRVSDEDILTLQSFRNRQTREKERRLLKEQQQDVTELEHAKEQTFGSRFGGILELLGTLFPDSRIEELHHRVYLLPYFDRRVFNRDIPFSGHATDVRVIAREDPVQPILVLHRIADNLLSSLDGGHVERVLDRDDVGERLGELRHHWKDSYVRLFDPYMKAVSELRQATEEEYGGLHYVRSVEEQVNQLRNLCFKDYGHIVLHDGSSGSKPLYQTVEELADLLIDIGLELNADLIGREDPVGKRMYRDLGTTPIVDFSIHAQPTSPDCKPTMRQLRRYIEAKYGNRVHLIPKLSQLFYLDVLRAVLDMYRYLVCDPDCFLRQTGRDVPVAGREEVRAWQRENEERGRDALDLIHLRLKEEQEEGLVDGLTGLRNKEYLLKRLPDHFAELRKRKARMSMLMIDIDHFKWVNDALGHPKGDEVLKDIGQTVLESIRRSHDVPVRYGGEEVLILIQAPAHTALLSAERLRHAQERHIRERELYAEIRKLPGADKEPCCTLSIGVVDSTACFDLEEAINQVDQALYKAKETRNQVVLGKRKDGDQLEFTPYADYARKVAGEGEAGRDEADRPETGEAGQGEAGGV